MKLNYMNIAIVLIMSSVLSVHARPKRYVKQPQKKVMPKKVMPKTVSAPKPSAQVVPAAAPKQPIEVPLAASAHIAQKALHPVANVAQTEYQKLMSAIHSFEQTIRFRTTNNRIRALRDRFTQQGMSADAFEASIAQKAREVRPIIDQSVMCFISSFIAFKQKYGSSIEKNLYKYMTVDDCIDRLLIKRPIMFMTASDSYLLRSAVSGYGGFETIGTMNERAPLILQDYISYDEMQIAALLGVSVPTYFINKGDRSNKAAIGAPGTYEPQGIYTGLVGARFEKEGLMEWQHMMITQEQNISQHGYGAQADPALPRTKMLRLWANLYNQDYFPTFQDVQSDSSGRYLKLSNTSYFDTQIFKKRIRLVIEPFLVDAHERGKTAQKKVYCHAVGLGLGVWQIHPIQAQLMLDVYADIIRDRDLSYISDIDFSWFPQAYQTCGGIGHLGLFKTTQNTITIHFSTRNPADKLMGSDANKLLVAMYAWDGNSYPGNEYWTGQLAASGDPAAACCSLITELQNPLINTSVRASHIFVSSKVG